ncbi:hypothetical protein QR680_008499 [Steinernema hermaphroditum]|uniref:Uncharacterized protein n=1 Tax=Steinernema hermaphroditum TaxID=289476 RepID=A0AA39IJ24_9BILA|nr:hypothetical protein QR680_008499 [Steinernema hermaphroditum]
MLGTLFLLLFCSINSAFHFGAVLQEKRDAHLAAALHYAVEWINHEKMWGTFELSIKYVNPVDYYEATSQACRLLEKRQIAALFGSADVGLNAQLQRWASSVNIPFFTAVDDLGIFKNKDLSPITQIDLFPKHQLLESLADLIRHWKWTRITIVFADIRRAQRLVSFLDMDHAKSVRFTFVRVREGDFLAAARQVKEVEECGFYPRKDCSEFSRVLLDLNPQDTYSFLLAALQMGLIELKHWFLLTSMDLKSMDMELFRHNHARFICVDPVDPTFINTTRSFILDKFKEYVRMKWEEHNPGSKNLRMAEAVLAFDSVYLAAHTFSSLTSKYPLLSEPLDSHCRTATRPPKPYKYGSQILHHAKNTALHGLTGDLQRINPTKKGNFSMRINLLGYNGNIDDIGFWEPVTDVHVNMTGDSKAQLQRNVQVSDELKPHFRVTTIMERPYVMLKNNHYELDQNSQFEGFCIDLLAELSRDLGFTYTIHLVKDRNYGNDRFGNGSWDGMIGEILRGEAEMAVAPLTVNFKRAEVVDFTKPFLSLGISILFKIPPDNQPDLFSFLNPLSLEIWICIVIAIVGLTLGMFLVARVTPYEWNLNFSCCTAHQPHPAAQFSPQDSPVELSNNYSFWNTLWYVTSTMLKGGCDFGPRAVSTRLLGGTWWVFTLVITSAYTANLAAVLTVSRPFIPIKNLDDLANQTSISYGTVKGGSTMQFFQESKIAAHVKMWNYMKDRDVFVENNGKGVEKVAKGGYAYLMESTSLEYEIQQNCNLTQIGGVLGSKGYGIALQKKSEWTDRISRQLLLYAKRGIIEMKKTKWWKSKGATCTGMGSAVKQQRFSLNISNVSGLFLILFAGLIFAIFTVVVEFFIRSRQVAKMEGKPLHKEILQELKFALNLSDVRDHRTRKKTTENQHNGEPMHTIASLQSNQIPKT